MSVGIITGNIMAAGVASVALTPETYMVYWSRPDAVVSGVVS